MATSLRQWWRRAAAALKDRRSLLLARLRPRRSGSSSSWHHHHHRELEAAVIRATSHEDRWMDYRSAARVFAWARASPSSSLRPAMAALARRARRTRCWVVALKALMVAHGLLLRSGGGLAPRDGLAVVPFELAGFRDRSSSSSKSHAFSAFVRAYFRFLDYRSSLFSDDGDDGQYSDDYLMATQLDRIAKRQVMLDLLLQIRPYGDGMEVPLVLEAMDCALVEIFQVYGEICTGIARFLVSGVSGPPAKPPIRKAAAAVALKVLWRAAEQSAQLSSYFELCQRIGVVNARKLPAAFVRLKDDDVRALERILMGDAQEDDAAGDRRAEGEETVALDDVKDAAARPAPTTIATTVVTTEWVAFEEEKLSDGGIKEQAGNHWNGSSGTLSSPRRRWTSGRSGKSGT
ncbi:hypothetical protein HU200_000418 [Digitaria exilis]|uniref:ENTH domain-containing protein n=1 Tax=Digitaria exilis TaxID=1010633 RepID=A0A835BDM9_9POAL|nr:hypothetical protein HU200_037702 [Digitaria exilis]KAF8783657.1 hypothetical protein HU200_000418 [Digitaria exilis]